MSETAILCRAHIGSHYRLISSSSKYENINQNYPYENVIINQILYFLKSFSTDLDR